MVREKFALRNGKEWNTECNTQRTAILLQQILLNQKDTGTCMYSNNALKIIFVVNYKRNTCF